MKYEIIYADFPWPYTSFGTAKLPYACMTEQEIKNFPIMDFAAKRCVMFLWVTGPKLMYGTPMYLRPYRWHHSSKKRAAILLAKTCLRSRR